MKLRLRITIKETKDYTKTQYRFAVIDLDKSKQYPQNFVCMLPKSIKLKSKPTNIFEKRFRNESIDIAKNLLEKALRSRPDSEKAKAIRERLKLLIPKKKKVSKCQSCGKMFEQKNQRFRSYKLCFNCYRKNYSK